MKRREFIAGLDVIVRPLKEVYRTRSRRPNLVEGDPGTDIEHCESLGSIVETSQIASISIESTAFRLPVRD